MTLKNFYNTDAKDRDVAVSSRIRLARNIESYAFGKRLSNEKAAEITEKAKQIYTSTPAMSEEYEFLSMDDMSENDAAVFAEQHVISPEFAQSRMPRALLVKKDGTASVMVNEEDHLRIQTMTAGFELKQTYENADKLDDLFEGNVKYAFSENLGYITHCPTNLGTGLRASVMVHIPCLVATGAAGKFINAASKLGIAVRGLYGEGSEAEGCFFQLSNQITMGVSEGEAIEKLESVVSGIIDAERKTREAMIKNASVQLKDRVFRSYGILKYAYSMATKEFMQRISDVRLGIAAGLITDITLADVDYLIISTHPAAIQKTSSNILTAQERDVKRAELCRVAFGERRSEG